MAERVLTLRLTVENAQANAALNQYNNVIRQAAQGTEGLKTNLINFNQTLSAVQSSWTALTRAFDIIGDVNMLGQSVNIAGKTFTALAGGTREATGMLELMRQKTGRVVTDFELMGGASRLLQMRLAGTKEQVAGLTEMAIKLGGALGMDTNKAVEDFSLLLANMSYLRLDQFGIAASTVRQRVRELAQEFPNMSREARFAQAVLEAGQTAMENLGPALNASSTAVSRFNTELENLAQRGAANVNYAIENMLLLVEELGSRDLIGLPQGPAAMASATVGAEDMGLDQNALRQQRWSNRTANMARGGVSDLLYGLSRGFDAIENFGDAVSRGVEAAEEQTRATEANTAALMQQANAISNTIAQMMGWTPPEQRELEGAQASVRDALTRAGLSESEMDAAMRAGEQLLPRYLEQGMSPAEAAMRAYGIQDTTPGVGADARYVGADAMDLLNVGNLPGFMSPDMSNYVGPMMLGGRIAPDFAWPTMRGTPGAMPTPNELDLGPFQDARYMRGGFEQAALQGSMLGYDAQMMTQTLAQAVAQGLQMAGVARGISDTMGGLPQIGDPLAIGMANYGQSQFNIPGYVQPNIPEPLVNQSLGGSWYQTMMGFMQPESPASFGGMSYENLPEYTTAVEDMAKAYDDSAGSSETIALAMEKAHEFTTTALQQMRGIVGDLERLKSGDTDIPIRLILDQHHFFIQVSNALSLFRLPAPGSGPS